MLSTNSWRRKSAAQMLHDLEPYLSELPIASVNNISFLESISCSTFEIRKEYSVSGYPNLGKGFSIEEAKLSGLMESLEMCCIESLIPIDWYQPSLQSLLRKPHDNDTQKVHLSAFLGDGKFIDIKDLILIDQQYQDQHAKGFTNGLASGQFLDDCIVHSAYELIERHMIGSSTRILVDNNLLNDDYKYLLSQIKNYRLSCNIYIRGQFANTITIESHIIDHSLSMSSEPYAGIGYGCSGNSDIAIARAIAEAFQCLSVAKSIYLHKFGLGTELTGPMYGYAPSLNEFFDSSLKMVEYILSIQESTTSKADFPLSSFNRVHNQNTLIYDLESEGINQFNYIILTRPDLPFTVVRCFIDQLSNSYGI